MKIPTRLVMVSAATAAVVVAGWQVRPSTATDEAEAALVTTPAAVEAAVPATVEPGATVIIDQDSSEAIAADEGLAGADFDADPGAGLASADSGDETGSNTPPAVPQATPAEGYLSAAPLDIDPTQSEGAGPKSESGESLDCRAFIGEEIRRDEADLIDWDALETYVELSEDDYANLDVEFVPFEEAMLVDGERPSFVDMGGPVDIGLLEVVRLLAVTDRCWDLGVYEEISESIYDEIYGDE